MQKYFEFGFYWDSLLVVLLIIFSCFGQSIINKLIIFQTVESLNGFIVSLITISATLLGFLLTIITVIVTFKKGFEDKTNNDNNNIDSNKKENIKSVFANTSKEEKFYSSNIHQKVVSVFSNASYEIGIILFLLLILQFKIINFSLYWEFVLSFCSLLMVFLSIIRSLYIFKLFLKVHL